MKCKLPYILGDNYSRSTQNTEEAPVLSNEFYLVYANPKEYKGRTVEFYGKVFVEPEKDSEGTLEIHLLGLRTRI